MTNDKQRVDFPVGENVREDKRGTPRGRLVELLRTVDNMRLMRAGFSECADYLLANGVIVPPCKVGDIVWCNIEGFDHPFKGMIRRVSVSKDFTTIAVGIDGYFEQHYLINDFGKKVFPTKEEAEQALVNYESSKNEIERKED